MVPVGNLLVSIMFELLSDYLYISICVAGHLRNLFCFLGIKSSEFFIAQHSIVLFSHVM